MRLRNKALLITAGALCLVVVVLIAVALFRFSRLEGLYHCAEVGDTITATKLLSSGVNPDQRLLWNGWSPLQVACNGGNIGVVRVMLDAGADPDYRGMYGVTALQVAAAANQQFAAEELIKHGADVNAQGGDGNTALHAAAKYGCYDAVEVLLDAGADKNIKNAEGQTPLDLARSSKYHRYRDVIAILTTGEKQN